MAEPTFRSDKEHQIWRSLLKDLGEDVGRPEDVIKVLGALTAAIGILPTDTGIKMALRNAVTRLKDEMRKAGKTDDEWNRRLRNLTSQVTEAGNSLFKTKLAADEKREEALKAAAAKALRAKEKKEELLVLRKELRDAAAQAKAMTSGDSSTTLAKETKVARVGKSIVGGADVTPIGSKGTADLRKALKAHVSPGDSTNNMTEVQEDKKEKQRRDFLSMFGDQVDMLRKMVRGGGEKEGSSMLWSALKWIGVGALGLGLAYKTGLLGLVKDIVSPIIDPVLEKVSEFMSSVYDWMKEKLNDVWEVVKGAGTSIMDAGAAARMWVNDKLAGIQKFAGDAWENIKKRTSDGVESVKSFFAPAIEDVRGAYEWTKQKLSYVGDFIGETAESIKGTANNVIDTVKAFVYPIVEAVSSAYLWVHDTVVSAFTTVNDLGRKWKESIDSIGTTIVDQLRSFIGDPTGYALEVARSIKDAFLEMVTGVATAVARSVAGGVGEFLRDDRPITEKATSAVTGAIATVRDRVTGVVRSDPALPSGTNSIMDTVTRWGAAAGDKTKSFISEGISNLTGKISNLFTTQRGVNIDDLDPRMREAFISAIQEYRMRGGAHSVVITSGVRTYEEQEKLHNEHPELAAPPGRSLHEFGLAIDADRRALTDMDRMGILAKYGLARPIRSEPWHVQPAGISASAAKAGVFSADAPKNQSVISGSRGSVTPSQIQTKPPSTIMKESAPAVTKGGPAPSSSNGVGHDGRSMSMGVGDVKTFSFNDSSLFALNLGVLSS